MNKIDVNKVFSQSEINLMEQFVLNYAAEEHSKDCNTKIPFLQVLDKCWATDKYNLYKIFGEKLILSKTISYTKSKNNLIREFEHHKYNAEDSDIWKFYYNIVRKTNEELERTNYSRNLSPYYNVFEAMEHLMSATYLAENEYQGNVIEFPTPNGKTIKVQSGAKVVKVLGKLAKAYDIPGYEEFRLEHSRILNTATVAGELCLSIHPLDYMTMSENDSDWTSCMNWHNRGCYRRGTVEMMNSPKVIVAYLRGSKDMIRFDEQWNNKKWRQLFVVTTDVIAGVKAYPYENSEISKIAINWIAEIFNASGKYNFDISSHMLCEYQDGSGFFPIANHSDHIPIEFTTNAMYNDFGCDVEHNLIFSKNYVACWQEYNYSGVSQCVWCGEEIENVYGDDGNYENPPERLVCGQCGAPNRRCDHCGDWFYDGDINAIDETFLCSYCLENQTVEDAFTGERHLINNTIPIYITDGGYNEALSGKYLPGLRLYRAQNIDKIINSADWLSKYPEVEIHTYEDWWGRSFTNYFIDIKACSPEARKNIHIMYGYSLEGYLNTLH